MNTVILLLVCLQVEFVFVIVGVSAALVILFSRKTKDTEREEAAQSPPGNPAMPPEMRETIANMLNYDPIKARAAVRKEREENE